MIGECNLQSDCVGTVLQLQFLVWPGVESDSIKVLSAGCQSCCVR